MIRKYVSIYLCLPQFSFFNILSFSVCKSFASLVAFILRYFILFGYKNLFDAVVHEAVSFFFLISIFYGSVVDLKCVNFCCTAK